jgi:phage tail sheath protein FI
MISAYLGELFRLNAFTGANESEAFFVRCDEVLNPPRIADAGQLLCEVGVAPAEPLEFIVLRIERGADGAIRVEG